MPASSAVAHLDGPLGVDLRRAGLLAEADDGHLRAPALDRALERRVRLDPVDGQDAVGAGGVGVEVQRHAVGACGRRPRSPSSPGSRRRPTSSVMPSSASIARWPSAVAPPWLPIAGTTNGSAPSSRSPAIVPRSSSTRPVRPRLPAPTATVIPGVDVARERAGRPRRVRRGLDVGDRRRRRVTPARPRSAAGR